MLRFLLGCDNAAVCYLWGWAETTADHISHDRSQTMDSAIINFIIISWVFLIYFFDGFYWGWIQCRGNKGGVIRLSWGNIFCWPEATNWINKGKTALTSFTETVYLPSIKSCYSGESLLELAFTLFVKSLNRLRPSADINFLHFVNILQKQVLQYT